MQLTDQCKSLPSAHTGAPKTLPGAPSSHLPELGSRAAPCAELPGPLAPRRGSPLPARTDAISHIHSPWHSQAVSPGDSSAVTALAARARSTAGAAECGQRAGPAFAPPQPQWSLSCEKRVFTPSSRPVFSISPCLAFSFHIKTNPSLLLTTYEFTCKALGLQLPEESTGRQK